MKEVIGLYILTTAKKGSNEEILAIEWTWLSLIERFAIVSIPMTRGIGGTIWNGRSDLLYT